MKDIFLLFVKKYVRMKENITFKTRFMKKQFVIFIAIFLFGMLFSSPIFASSTSVNSQSSGDDYTVLRDIDKGTYNEYRHYMVREYLKLKGHYELNYTIDATIANNLLRYARTGYNYLPDSLINQGFLNDLSTAVQRWISNPSSEVNYNEIVKKLEQYVERVNIQNITWSIEATPTTWNAPLTTTLRARVSDPTGTTIPSSNYIWWMSEWGRKVIIGRGTSVNFTFQEDKNYTVFLDVKSAHKNPAWYTDVLSYQSRMVIQVKEKIASILVKVNSLTLGTNDELKFTPDESNYGLIFDATSSIPTGWARFLRTEWDFWNGIVRRYDGAPRIERVIYSQEWIYPVVLKLSTNEGQTIERKFSVFIHKPIASIVAHKTDGYVWERFSFATVSSVAQRNLAFTWNVMDVVNDKIIVQHTGNTFNHSFTEKGRYNIQLRVKDAAGNEDIDSKIIHINSREPVAEFSYSIPNRSKPNRVLLDATKSYDLDFSDAGKLRYRWTINGEWVNIENLDSVGAIWYYTFDSIWDQTVALEVVDPDEMSSIKTQKVRIDSILDVDFWTFPRVIQRWGTIRFVADSANARIYEWDFWDGNRDAGSDGKVNHIYQKSGIYNVKLTVRDSDGKINDTTKTVYVGESNAPYALIGVDYGNVEKPEYQSTACNTWAYVVDRTKTVTFRGGESLDINGETTGLTYSWKIWYDKYISGRDTTYRFTELGCFPIKLTVRSDKNGATSVMDTWIRVENLKPTLSWLGISVQNENADPVIVNVVANGAQDPDGVIQSYLWYYYTDTDTDPQDFRSTIVPNTTFVIPKITGNYYFVVVMRDNNDERFSSESLSNEKYFITLSWDNINTPLVDFRVNKTSIMAGDSVVFQASAKNVLGTDITERSEYAWDFDGDGFYDVETQEPSVEHTYETSGTFYAKVRVKYKGMTNVRTIEVNVSNVLEPDFEYTSIWDKFIFYNTSRGKVDSVVWNMWDGNTVYDKNYFTYTYEDGKPIHQVEIKITEGTKVRNKTLSVAKNMRNMLQVKNAEGIVVYSFPEIVNEEIILKTPNQKVYVYLGESKWNFTHYGVDFDIAIDSDLNGGKDDDIDNKNDPSYTDGVPLEITLNDSREQKVRVMLLRADGGVIDSKDITIVKQYITETSVDMSKLTFEWVSDGEKAKIEKIKSYIQWLPQEHRLKWMQYVQKLQENWFYPIEKTKIILEFEAFIDSTWVSNALEINTTLESLLVEWQEDQSVRNMAYNVIKNLIPKELVTYAEIIETLDIISSSPENIEENKVFGKQILEMIKDTSLITNDDKLTIKNQLQVFIYGSVDNIPVEIKNEIVKEQPSGGNKVIWLFSWLASIIGILLWSILVIVIWFALWFKLTNKNKNQWLQDFIIEKTNFDKDPNAGNDVLADVWSEKVQETKKSDLWEKKDIFTPKTDAISPLSKDPLTQITEVKPQKEVSETPKIEKVPDWLAGALEKTTDSQDASQSFPHEVKKEPEVPESLLIWETWDQQISEWWDILPETKIEDSKIPSWLSGALDEKEETQEEPSEVISPKWADIFSGVESTQSEEIPNIFSPNEENQLDTLQPKVEKDKVSDPQQQEKVPDWLAWALDVGNLTKETQKSDVWTSSSQKVSKDLNQKETVTRDLIPKVPKEKAEKKETVSWKKAVSQKQETQVKAVSKKTSPKKEEVIKEETQKEPIPKKTTSKTDPVSNDELWNDGMDIPDWLKPDNNIPKPSKKDDIWTIDTIQGDDTKK